jgi:hypothetical protein
MRSAFDWGWGLLLAAPLVVGCAGKSVEQTTAGTGGTGAGGASGVAGTSGAADSCDALCAIDMHWDPRSGVCAPNGANCETADDCHEPLPHSCITCPDGTLQCAHHECVDGGCAIETCAPGKIPQVCGPPPCYLPCPAQYNCSTGGGCVPQLK